MKSREVELGSHRWTPWIVFLLSCSSAVASVSADTVFVTLRRTAVETAISGVDELLRTGGWIPTSSTLKLFRRWLVVSPSFYG